MTPAPPETTDPRSCRFAAWPRTPALHQWLGPAHACPAGGGGGVDGGEQHHYGRTRRRTAESYTARAAHRLQTLGT